MRIGFIGSGSIAGEHAKTVQALQQTPEGRDLVLEAVVGRQAREAEAFARTYGMRVGTTNLDVMLGDPAIDAVIVCSPTDLHASHSEQALRAGKHVLCEIPLATSLAETDKLIAFADENDRRLMVCQTQRYFRPLIEARRMIAEGELHPHAVVSRYLFNRRNNVNWKGRDRSWTDNLLWHHTCHALDATLWLLGASEVEAASQIADPDPVLGIPMEVAIVLRTPASQIATVATSYHAMLPQHDYLVIGEETSVQFVNRELRSPEGILVPATGDDPLPDAMPRQNAEFFAAIREGREPAVSGRSVRPAMAVLQSVQDQLDARLGVASAGRSS
jgi:2-hydroxy-4-carboxymuconate semialdehyde hemiacetal dehydrogenase